jgi:hypothetical protein
MAPELRIIENQLANPLVIFDKISPSDEEGFIHNSIVISGPSIINGVV